MLSWVTSLVHSYLTNLLAWAYTQVGTAGWFGNHLPQLSLPDAQILFAPCWFWARSMHNQVIRVHEFLGHFFSATARQLSYPPKVKEKKINPRSFFSILEPPWAQWQSVSLLAHTCIVQIVASNSFPSAKFMKSLILTKPSISPKCGIETAHPTLLILSRQHDSWRIPSHSTGSGLAKLTNINCLVYVIVELQREKAFVWGVLNFGMWRDSWEKEKFWCLLSSCMFMCSVVRIDSKK